MAARSMVGILLCIAAASASMLAYLIGWLGFQCVWATLCQPLASFFLMLWLAQLYARTKLPGHDDDKKGYVRRLLVVVGFCTMGDVIQILPYPNTTTTYVALAPYAVALIVLVTLCCDVPAEDAREVSAVVVVLVSVGVTLCASLPSYVLLNPQVLGGIQYSASILYFTLVCFTLSQTIVHRLRVRYERNAALARAASPTTLLLIGMVAFAFAFVALAALHQCTFCNVVLMDGLNMTLYWTALVLFCVAAVQKNNTTSYMDITVFDERVLLD